MINQPANTVSILAGAAVQAGRPTAAFVLRPKTATAAQLVAVVVDLAAARPAAAAADAAAVARAQVRLDALPARAATSGTDGHQAESGATELGPSGATELPLTRSVKIKRLVLTIYYTLVL